MANRYFVKGNTACVTVTPDEHRHIRALGFERFSAYDAIKYPEYYAPPVGWTIGDMHALTNMVREGKVGTFVRQKPVGLVFHEGKRPVKHGRGQTVELV